MKKYIDQILGDNLRCILPSFWWKKLLYKMADRISYAETAASSASSTVSTVVSSISSAIGDKQDKLYSGSNIKTVNGQSILGSGNITINTERMEKYKTKEELDAVGSTDGGEIAAVVDDVLIEKSFAECYQPTGAEINANKYNAKFTKVNGLVLNPDFNPNLISSNYGSLRVVLYSDGNSKGHYEDHLSHLDIVCDANRAISYYEYSSTTSIGTGHRLYDSSGFYASNIDIVNNILREGDFRFSYFEVTYRNDVSVDSYTYYYSYNANFPSDATAMIDNVVKMLFAETQNADVYVRSKEWVRLLKEGDVTGGGADITIDSELSDTSENPVQNKVVTEAFGILEEHLAVHSKQISSLGLSMATKEELNNKADKSDIKTINGESILGEGNIVVNADTSTLATKEEVNNLINELIDDEEILAHALNELNDKVANISEELSGDFASKEDIETLAANDVANQEAIESVSDSVTTLSERVDNIATELTEDFATKEELQTSNEDLTNEVIDDEEVLVYAINDLNAKIKELTARIVALEGNNA